MRGRIGGFPVCRHGLSGRIVAEGLQCSQGQVCEIDFDEAEQIMKAPVGDSKDWAAAFLTDAAKNHLLIKMLTEGKDIFRNRKETGPMPTVLWLAVTLPMR
jgi:hypothetical protein